MGIGFSLCLSNTGESFGCELELLIINCQNEI
jgi:hypothetical protein